MALLTIFTPAFNRANTLGRTYESLLAQSCKDFVWMIVDDGSTDNTSVLVESWKKRKNGFEIIYIYKENGGMHTAHNTAYENINTELNVCIDSDDKMADEAVKKIVEKWEKVKTKGYAGLIGLDADFENQIIGLGFPDFLQETTLSDYYKNGGKGDKKLVYRTDVIKSIPPYPVFDNEKYVSLAYKYRLVDQKYKLAVLNDVLCNVEYQIDGSSNSMIKQYVTNPKGFAFWRKICMKYPTSTKRMIMDVIHYISSSFISRNKNFIKESPKKLLTVMLIPFGAMLTVYIKYKYKKNYK